jgi:hypothetical protein
MLSRNLSRRLERLEELTMASDLRHVITVTYVNPDGTQAGDGYRIEGPLPGGEWLRTTFQRENASDEDDQ